MPTLDIFFPQTIPIPCTFWPKLDPAWCWKSSTMLSFIFIFGLFIMARATPIAPKPDSTTAIEASPTPLQTPASDESDRFTEVAIGLTVLSCIIAVFTMAGLVFLCCSATRRRSNEGGLGDVELQQSQTANAPAQTPTRSQPEQQNALPEVSQAQPGRSGRI
jgi:hypothetical protein